MKTIGIISFNDPEKRGGGVEVVVYNLAKYLSKKYQIVVFAASNIDEVLDTEFYKLVKIKVKKNFLTEFIYIFKLRSIVKQYDLNILLDNGGLSLFVKKNFNMITIVHGTNAGNALSRKIQNIKDLINFLYRVFWWFVQNIFFIFKSDVIVAISSKVEIEIKKYYFFTKNKIEIISNASEISIDKSEVENILQNKEKNTVLFVSTNHFWKGYGTLVELARERRDYKFFVCGSSVNSDSNNIFYLGYLNSEELKKAYLKYQFFIMPSQYEGQSLAMLDAIASGQILATEILANPCVDSSGVHIIENRKKDEYLKILDLSEEEKRRQSMENIDLMNGVTWEIQTEKYVKIIEKFI